MNSRSLFAMTCLLSAGIAQQTSTSPELRITITPEKASYAIKEPVLVRAEMKNVSTQTLCFPEPAQDCHFGPTGSLLAIGEPVTHKSERVFICIIDGGGPIGRELDNAVKNDWIRLEPGKSYISKPAKAHVMLDEGGDWRLSATYEPPEGSFDREYRQRLRVAAAKAGCHLPDRVAVAETKMITVTP